MNRAPRRQPGFWARLGERFWRSKGRTYKEAPRAEASGLPRAVTAWGYGTFNEGVELVDDPHTGPLARILKTHAPLDYMRWYHNVFSTTVTLRELQISLGQLYQAQLGALQGLSRAKARVSAYREELNRELRLMVFRPFLKLLNSFGSYDRDQTLTDMCTIGLSFVMLQGLLEQSRIELTDVATDELLLLSIIIFASFGITFGIKWAVANMVQNRAQQGRATEPFWNLFLRGDSTLYMCLVFIGIEMAMASPFFIQRLPLSLRDELAWRLSAVMCAGMFAIVNVSLGWNIGSKKVREGVGVLVASSGGVDSALGVLDRRHSTYRNLRLAREEVTMYERTLEELRPKIASTEAALADLEPKAVRLCDEWQEHLQRLVEKLQAQGVDISELFDSKEGR